MQIKINKTAQEKLHQQELQEVLTYAQSAANEGKESFYHTKHRNTGLSSHELIDMVKKETNNSIFVGYGCIQDGTIRFTIRD
jgi:hypothetical protein